LKSSSESFSRKWAALFSGAMLSHLISFLTLLALGNLVMPSIFGQYVLMTSTVALFSTVSTLRLESGISSAKSDFAVLTLIFWSLKISVGLSLLLSLVLFGFRSFVDDMIPFSGHGYILFPLLLMTYSLLSLVTQLAIRERAFSTLAWRGGLQNAVIGIFQVISCLNNASVEVLVLSEIIGRAVGLLLFSVPVMAFFQKNSKDVKSVMTKKSSFDRSLAFYMTSAALLDTAASSAIIVFVSFFFGSEVGGYFAMSQKLLAFPVALLGATFGQVLLGDSALIIRTSVGNLTSLFFRSLRILAGLSVFLSLIALVLAPSLMALALGNEWKASGDLVQLLALSFAINLMWNPLSTLYIAMNLWRLFFFVSAARFASIFLTGFLVYLGGNEYGITIFTMALAGSIVQLLGLYFLSVRVIKFPGSEKDQ